MPISRRRSGIDITALTPFNKEIGVTTNANNLIPVLSITGKGYISSFYMYTQNVASSGAYTIKMTIDGVVKMLLTTTSGTRLIGLIDKLTVMGTSAAGGLRVPSSTTIANNVSAAFKSYPITDSSDGIIILGDSLPIYFYQSLLLEVAGPITPTTQAIYYIYQGGSL